MGKKLTTGERIARKFYREYPFDTATPAKDIDAAVRKAAWEGRDLYFSMSYEQFAAKYGPRPGRVK